MGSQPYERFKIAQFGNLWQLQIHEGLSARNSTGVLQHIDASPGRRG